MKRTPRNRAPPEQSAKWVKSQIQKKIVCNGKYFGQKSLFIPLPVLKNPYFFPVFTANFRGKLYVLFCKGKKLTRIKKNWREAAKFLRI